MLDREITVARCRGKVETGQTERELSPIDAKDRDNSIENELLPAEEK